MAIGRGSSSTDTTATEYRCCDLLVRFYRHLDRREYVELCGLMTADGTWRRREGVTRAGEELLAALAKRSRDLTIAHVLTNLAANITDADHAVVRGYMTVFRDETGAKSPGSAKLNGPSSIIAIEAKCSRASGDWLISSIDNTWLFKA